MTQLNLWPIVRDMTTNAYLASYKQINFLRNLVAERDASTELLAEAMLAIDLGTEGMGSDASASIAALLKCAKKPVQPNANEVTEEGFYIHDGEIYRVKRGKVSKKLYANKLHIHMGNHAWDYAPGAFKLLTADSKLTAEQAMEFGKTTGHCAYCGRALEDDLSRAYYMGPVCSEKYAGIKRSKSMSAYGKAAEILIARGETPNGMPMAAKKAMVAA